MFQHPLQLLSLQAPISSDIGQQPMVRWLAKAGDKAQVGQWRLLLTSLCRYEVTMTVINAYFADDQVSELLSSQKPVSGLLKT